MKNNLYYSVRSRQDLNEIWDYIVTELQNPTAAERVVNGIMDIVDQLEDFAEIGAPLSSITDVDNDYRFLVSSSYLVFYRTSGRDVYVDRILYGRRDYLRILFGDLPAGETSE